MAAKIMIERKFKQEPLPENFQVINEIRRKAMGRRWGGINVVKSRGLEGVGKHKREKQSGRKTGTLLRGTGKDQGLYAGC
ncbi:MAG: hypothetical protein JRI79_06595 [Deltaproteobacteria bacterium]|nr:hypothetical protein [Deltaproteobacteria bacterium]